MLTFLQIIRGLIGILKWLILIIFVYEMGVILQKKLKGKMKSSGQRKRKVREVSRENRTGAVVKNSASRNSDRRWKTAG